MSVYIDLDEWIDEQYWAAYRQQQPSVLSAFNWHEQARQLRLTNPQQAADQWGQAAELAYHGGNPCLGLFFQTRQCTAYAYWLGDYRQGLDLAARMVAEVRKYPQCPTAAMVYRNAISMHLAVDPVGYQEKIEEMFAYVEQQVPLDHSRRCLLTYDHIELALALDDRAEALHYAQLYLEQCQSHPQRFQMEYMAAGALEMLGRLAALRGDWDQALDYVQQSEKLARRSENLSELISALYWQALVAYRRGATIQGADLFAAAEVQRQRIEHRVRPFFELLVQLYLLRNEGAQITPLMQEVLAITQRGGELYGECGAWLTWGRCLGQLGQPVEVALAGARQAATQLLKPTSFLAKVARVAAGDYTE
jgi:hypothetical protein